jgi:signal transduction histidine kinase
MLVSLTAADFLRYLSWVIFGLIGIWSLAQAVRRPNRVNIDVALLFGGLTVAIVWTALVRAGLIGPSPLNLYVTGTAVVSMPFLLVRLMDDVVGVPQRLMRGFMLLFALYLAVIWFLPLDRLGLFALPLLLGLLATLGYVVVLGVRGARRSRGVTKRRLFAVTLGSLFLACNFAAGRLPSVLPITASDARSLVDVFGVLSGASYFVGFAPPRWLRRVWQAPELRSFLLRTVSLPQTPDLATMLSALAQGAADALGAPQASIGLWNEGAQSLRFLPGGVPFDLPQTSDLPVARAFRLQRPIFSRATVYDADLDARFNLRANARAVLAAPMTVGERRLGVLGVYGPRAPLFSDDDLALVRLLADQAAMVVESRRLSEESAHVRAREEAARLKEDFLSAAAHDLKTPLTTLVMQAQLFERRAVRNPGAPADLAGLRRLTSESERLRAMVLELLDAARADQALVGGGREPLDLAAAARDVAQRHENGRHAICVEAPDALVGLFDGQRIVQLIENLVENAIKYSPNGGVVTIRLWQDEHNDHLSVADEGIGIPAEDLPHLFDRFHRGNNVDDRRFPGWGLGLSICHRIVEQHGGQILVSSRLGAGTTFHVTLPRIAEPQEHHAAAHPGD